MIGACPYLWTAHNPIASRNQLERLAVRVLELQSQTPFEALAFRGMSGAAVCYPLQFMLGIALLNVRKEGMHHGRTVEGPADRRVERYLIVDDQIDSGATVRAIIDGLYEHAGLSHSGCAGILLYHTAYSRGSFPYYPAGKPIPVYSLDT